MAVNHDGPFLGFGKAVFNSYDAIQNAMSPKEAIAINGFSFLFMQMLPAFFLIPSIHALAEGHNNAGTWTGIGLGAASELFVSSVFLPGVAHGVRRLRKSN